MATSRSRPTVEAQGLLRRLIVETDESATVKLFVQLCRRSAALRQWLWEDFARDPAARSRFARLLKGAKAVAVERVSQLTADETPREEELRQLRAKFSDRIYGGLNWREVEALVGQFRAGRADLAAYLLALQWRRAGAAALDSPQLLRCAAAFLDPALRTGDRHRLNQLRTAVALVAASISPRKRRTAIGYSEWWKLQLVSYLLRNPRPSYRTRELHAHLVELGLKVSAKDIRRFCARHGISRDMRAGRPTGAKTRTAFKKLPLIPRRPASTASELHRP